jgi:TolC family type I secretion outer membrane protein
MASHTRWITAPSLVAALLLSASPMRAAGQEAGAGTGKRALTLAETVRSALAANHGLMASSEQVAVASARYQQARSIKFPQLSASSQAFRSHVDRRRELTSGLLTPAPENRYDEANLALNARQTVLDFSRWKTSSSAHASEEAAEYSYRADQEDLVLEVQQAYYNYLKTARLLSVAEENVKVGEEQLKLAEKKLEVGTGVSADVLRAKAQTAADRLAVIDAKKNLDIARQTLNHLMGLPLDAPLVVEDIDIDEPPAPPPVVDVEASMEARPDLITRRQEVEAAEHSVGAAQAQRYPTLGVQLSYTRLMHGLNATYEVPVGFEVVDGDTSFIIGTREAETDPYGSWFAAAQLDLPLFTGGNTKGRINETRAALRAAQETLAESELAARLDVETAMRNAEAAVEAMEVSREGVAAAEEENRLSQGFYTHGLVPILNLVESQAALVEARTSAVNAVYDYWIALASLDRALGRGVARFAP